MQPKDNSDNSWLVYCDWLEDHDVVGAAELRQQIMIGIHPQWTYEYRSVGVGGGVGGVGGRGGRGGRVGGIVGVGGGGRVGGIVGVGRGGGGVGV